MAFRVTRGVALDRPAAVAGVEPAASGLESTTQASVRIRCFATEKDPPAPPLVAGRQSPRPTPTGTTRWATRNLRWGLLHAEGKDFTNWVYVIRVYKIAPDKRYWPAAAAEVSVDVVGLPQPALSLGKTQAELLRGSEVLVMEPRSTDPHDPRHRRDAPGQPDPRLHGRRLRRLVHVSATLVIPSDEQPPPYNPVKEGVPLDMEARVDFVFSTGRDVEATLQPAALRVSALPPGERSALAAATGRPVRATERSESPSSIRA